jgi:hypothetical protein
MLHGMDDMIGEPDKNVGGWPGSVTHLLHIRFILCHTSPTAPYAGPVLSLQLETGIGLISLSAETSKFYIVC